MKTGALSELNRFSNSGATSSGYPLPKLLRKYSYLTCTFVILTGRLLGLSWNRARCVQARASLRGVVKGSLTSRRGIRKSPELVASAE